MLETACLSQINLFEAALALKVNISSAGLDMFRPSKIDKIGINEKVKKRYHAFRNSAKEKGYAIDSVVAFDNSIRINYTDIDGSKMHYIVWDNREQGYPGFCEINSRGIVIEYKTDMQATQEQVNTLEEYRKKNTIVQVIRRRGDPNLYAEVNPYKFVDYHSDLLIIGPNGEYNVAWFNNFSYDNDEVLEINDVDYSESFLQNVKNVLSCRLKSFSYPSSIEHYYWMLQYYNERHEKYGNVEIPGEGFSGFKDLYNFLTDKGFVAEMVSFYENEPTDTHSHFEAGGYKGDFFYNTGFGIVELRIFNENPSKGAWWDFQHEHTKGIDRRSFVHYAKSIEGIKPAVEMFFNALNDFIIKNSSQIQELIKLYNEVYSETAPWDSPKVVQFYSEGKFIPRTIREKYPEHANILTTWQEVALEEYKNQLAMEGKEITFIVNDFRAQWVAIEYKDPNAATRGTSVIYIKRDGTTWSQNDFYADADAYSVILYCNRNDKIWSEQNKALDKFKKEYKGCIRRVIKRKGSSNCQIEYRDKSSNKLMLADMSWSGSITTYSDVKPLFHINDEDIILDNSGDDLMQLSLI